MQTKKIRVLCAEKGITLAQLERELNLSNGSIAKWEKHAPRVGSVKAVADYFGVTVDSLL